MGAWLEDYKGWKDIYIYIYISITFIFFHKNGFFKTNKKVLLFLFKVGAKTCLRNYFWFMGVLTVSGCKITDNGYCNPTTD